MIIENVYNAYFIYQNYMVAKTSSLDKILKSALHLYNYSISEYIKVVLKFVLFTEPLYHMIPSQNC